MVTVRMSGQKQLLSVTLDPSLLASGDKEMLEDLLVAAVNQASQSVDETLQSKMGGLGGLGLPGM